MRYLPWHCWQYHCLIPLAIFSVTFIQCPWNHSLQLSQPLWTQDGENLGKNKIHITGCKLHKSKLHTDLTSWNSWCLVFDRCSTEVVSPLLSCFCPLLFLGPYRTSRYPKRRWAEDTVNESITNLTKTGNYLFLSWDVSPVPHGAYIVYYLLTAHH